MQPQRATIFGRKLCPIDRDYLIISQQTDNSDTCVTRYYFTTRGACVIQPHTSGITTTFVVLYHTFSIESQYYYGKMSAKFLGCFVCTSLQ